MGDDRFPCDLAVKKVLPAVKHLVAEHLYRKHGWSQVRIAEALGVTQSTVSRYIRGKRGVFVRKVLSLPGVEEEAEAIADMIASGEPAPRIVERVLTLASRVTAMLSEEG